MRRPRHHDDAGAVLILVLVVTSLLGLTTLAMAEFVFASSNAANTFAQQQRITNALDAGLAGAAEQVRAEQWACPSPSPSPLVVEDADGNPDGGSPLAVSVTCIQTGTDRYGFVATAFFGSACADPVGAQRADVRVGAAGIQRIARVIGVAPDNTPMCGETW